MNKHRTDEVLSAMIARDRDRRHRRRLRYRRFGIRSLLILMILCCLGFAAARQWGADVVQRVRYKANQSLEVLPETRVSEVLPPLCVLGGILLGTILAAVIYKLDARKSFLLFGGVFFASLVTLVCALSLEIEPFRDTELQDMTLKQVLFGASMALTLILPAAALLGWYLSGVGHPER